MSCYYHLTITEREKPYILHLQGAGVRETDLPLVKHEFAEQYFERKYDLTYEKAHEIANRKFNWSRAVYKKEEG